jgi:hypothetical protein
MMNRLDHRGHGPIAEWSRDAASRRRAAAEFAQHRARGYRMVDVSDGSGKAMTVFDAEVAEILAIPQLAGG